MNSDNPIKALTEDSHISGEQLLASIRRKIEEGATSLVIQTHYGDVPCEVVELWEAGGVIKIGIQPPET